MISKWHNAAMFEVFLQDLRYAVRALRLNPGISATAILSLALGIGANAAIFTLVNAVMLRRVQPSEALKSEGHGFTAGAGPHLKFALRNILITVQISLSALLLVCAGLLLASFLKLKTLNPGFQPERVLLARVDFRNGNPVREFRVWQMLERLRELSGVRSASVSSVKPLCGCDWTAAVVINGSSEGPGNSEVFSEEVSDSYFQTMGIPIMAGRDFQAFDTPASPPVALINLIMAKKFFGDANPIGRYYQIRNGGGLSAPIQIVGIVGDAKVASLREPSVAAAYTDQRQDAGRGSQYQFELLVGTEPTALIPAVKSAIGKLDPSAVVEFDTLTKHLTNSLSQEQMLAVLAGLYGALALLLTSVGLYALVSYNVVRRRKEIAIRMALGAQAGRIRRLVIGEATLMVAVGLTLGLGEALVTTRFIQSFLYGLAPTDPSIFVFALATLAVVATSAGYIQAHRAASSQPLDALRAE